jgi:hypothetical protein
MRVCCCPGEYLKPGEENTAIVDAAMNDLMRPALYDAITDTAVVRKALPVAEYEVVGPVCERDFLGMRANWQLSGRFSGAMSPHEHELQLQHTPPRGRNHGGRRSGSPHSRTRNGDAIVRR